MTDQDIPGLRDHLVGVYSGTGDMYFQHEQGRRTGMDDGRILEEIPGSAAFPVFAAGSQGSQMYVVAAAGRLTAASTSAGCRAGPLPTEWRKTAPHPGPWTGSRSYPTRGPGPLASRDPRRG